MVRLFRSWPMHANSPPNHASVRRRRTPWWIVIGLVAGLATGLGALTWFRAKGPTPSQLDRRVRAALPLGTTEEQARAWLQAEGITFLSEDGGARDMIGSRSVSLRAGLTDGAIARTIRAIIEPAFVDLLFDGELHAYLFFDPKGQLIGYDFVPFAHAP